MTDHTYLVCDAHRYGQDRAENPDDQDHHLGPGLGDMGPQGEHDGLISELIKSLELVISHNEPTCPRL